MILGLCHGLNVKRLVPAVIAVFAVFFATDFILHGKLLEGAYQATANLWRTDADMKGHCVWMLLGQFLLAKFFTVLFAKGYEGKGWMEGVRFGLLIGPFYVAHFFIQYAVTQLPSSLLWVWVAAGLIQCILAGIVAALVYKK